jgi:hypothetical protein
MERSGDTAFARAMRNRTKENSRRPKTAGARVCDPQQWTVFKAASIHSTRLLAGHIAAAHRVALQNNGRLHDFRPRESGVALRFPPHSKTSRNLPPVFQNQATVLFEPL